MKPAAKQLSWRDRRRQHAHDTLKRLLMKQLSKYPYAKQMKILGAAIRRLGDDRWVIEKPAAKPTRRPEATWWAVEWRSRNSLDGARLVWEPEICLFRTRRECRKFIDERYGYIKTRPDLKAEPHGWLMPVAVRVGVWRLKPSRGKAQK